MREIKVVLYRKMNESRTVCLELVLYGHKYNWFSSLFVSLNQSFNGVIEEEERSSST